MHQPDAAFSLERAEGLRRELRLPALGQVGFVVGDLEKTAAFYRKVFGLGPWAILEGETVHCTNLGDPVTIRGRVGMAQVGSVQFELIQIEEGPSIHLDFLREKGEGLHHIGFFVRDLDRRMDACRQAGIRTLQEGTLKQSGLTIRYAYLDTVAVGGVIFEYIEPRLGPVPVRMRPWMMKVLGHLAGR